MKECEICGAVNAQLHHIIHRSSASYMINIKINHKHLCLNHHTGNEGPHLNPKMDMQYKLEMQKKLFELFSDKEYFTENEIMERLETTPKEVTKIIKCLRLRIEGYERLDIVIRCMGGKLYVK